jgi:hypothetical protein
MKWVTAKRIKRGKLLTPANALEKKTWCLFAPGFNVARRQALLEKGVEQVICP